MSFVLVDLLTPLKVIHVLSAIVAVGANLTYAFWLRRAGLDRDRLVFAIGGIRGLDRRVANPAYILLLLTGLGMVATGVFSFGALWLDVALLLYIGVAVLGIAVFAPAVRRQLDEAQADPTSAAYAAAARRTTVLGWLTTGVAVVIVILMVSKPTL
jgi:uncharacterized membrane protein